MDAHTYGPLNIAVTIDSMFQENTLLLWTQSGPECWIVDPGFPPAAENIATMIQKKNLRPIAVVLTHGHVDHIAGIQQLRDLYPDIKICAPHKDADMLPDPQANLSATFGFPIIMPEADKVVEPEQTMTLGGVEFRALNVSGHSPGGMAYYCEAAGIVIVGDALFAGSIGRTDFPGSDLDQLLDNISHNLLTLPDETITFSGHGPTSTIGDEQANNPFIRRGYSG